ncbi:ari-2 [Symbiodinium natans]|uniref:Ari-2 protein n=1 Tax=Symbiodinium natans TaxID=878477 RepID=A0A812QY75_9DINO|nr:ari-2 [Symbiodinium natans]
MMRGSEGFGLRNLVRGQLVGCRERWQLEVSCPEPGCLVLQVEEARALAEAIDGSSLWPCLGEEEVTRCPLCGAAGPVYANRACGHGACEGCWLADLEDKLRWGRENAAMDIPCVHKGCSEGCFETLGLFESPLLEEVGLFVREAKRKVQELSPWCARGPPAAAGPLCPECGRRSLALLHCSCDLVACTSCWQGFVQQQLARCQESFQLNHLSPLGWHPWRPGCSCQEDLLELLAPSLAALFAEHALRVQREKRELRRLAPYAVPRKVADGPAPPCPICGEVCLALLHPPGCEEGHMACAACWAKWAEEQIESCRRGNHFPSRCLWPNCEANVRQEDRLWHLVKGSPQLTQLVADLDRRHRLQQSHLYPPEVQVDCPQPLCVGLGYLGFDTVMCFICEHQWDAFTGVVESAETEVPDEEVAEAAVAGVRVKRCPNCHEYIEKNGGCDHMTCRCRHEFAWTTLKPWRRAGGGAGT